MKRFLGLFVLLSLLAACSETPDVTAPDTGDAAHVASFQFDIDPGSEQVGVTEIKPADLRTQDFQLDPATQLVLQDARYVFGANNTLTIKAIFTNATPDSSFSQLFFSPAQTPRIGSYSRSSEPDVTDADLGGDGVLSPGEKTATLTFTVYHYGRGFSYRINAFAEVDPSTSVSCGSFPDGVSVKTQADIDALRGCTTIEGDFVVDTNAKTLDFSPLDGLQTITGQLVIVDNPNLNAVSGFGGLEAVEDFGMYIYGNPELTSITGFGRLESVNNFAIYNNASLIFIEGFGSLNPGEGRLFDISDNPALTTLPEFGALTTTGNFTLDNNDALVSFSGFRNLEQVLTLDPRNSVASFSVSGNASLVSFSGFDKLRSVDNNFSINDNASLTAVSGFDVLDLASGNRYFTSRINNNPVFDCSAPPQNALPFLPVDESTDNLVNCPTE